MCVCYIYMHLYRNSDIAGDFLHLNLGNKERMKKQKGDQTFESNSNDANVEDQWKERKWPYFFQLDTGNNRTMREKRKKYLYTRRLCWLRCLSFLALRNWSSIPPLKKKKSFLFFFLTSIVPLWILYYLSFRVSLSVVVYFSPHLKQKWRNRCDGYDFYERKSKSNYFTFFSLSKCYLFLCHRNQRCVMEINFSTKEKKNEKKNINNTRFKHTEKTRQKSK